MKKALSLFVALALVMSAFWLCTTASASGDVDVTIFAPEFGGRKNYSTDGTWGQVVKLKIGDAAAKTYNANGAVTSTTGVEALDGKAIVTSDAGTLNFNTYGNNASMISVTFWSDASKNGQDLWAEAYQQILDQHGSAKVDGLSVQYTVTNNGNGVAHIATKLYIPGVKISSGAPLVKDGNGTTQEKRYGNNEYIWPGETLTFEYKLEALVEDSDGNMVEDEFLLEDVDRGDSGAGVSAEINVVNDTSYSALTNSLDLTVSPFKIVNTTDDAITVDDQVEYIEKPQVDAVKPWRPYRQSGEQPTTTTVPAETTTTTTTTTTTASPDDPYVSAGVYLPATSAVWNGGSPEEVEGVGGGTKVEGEGTLTETWTKDAWQYQVYTWSQQNASVITDDAVGIRFKLKVNSVGNTDVPLSVKFVFTNYSLWPVCVKPITANIGEEAEYVMLLSEFGSGMTVDQLKAMNHQQLRVMATDGSTTLGGCSFTFSDIEVIRPNASATTTTTTTTTVAPEDKPGDVNCDGEINLADVRVLVANIAAGTTDELTEQAKKNADVNADTNIDLADVRFLVSAIAGGDFSILK